MENKIIYIDLCEALSEIFVDNEVDIKYISSVAKKFPIEKVEYIFFEWVAPVCYTNPLTPAPSVWAGYDKQELWDEICAYQTKKNHLMQLNTSYSFYFLSLFLKMNGLS